jgi:hypothetical protein
VAGGLGRSRGAGVFKDDVERTYKMMELQSDEGASDGQTPDRLDRWHGGVERSIASAPCSPWTNDHRLHDVDPTWSVTLPP